MGPFEEWWTKFLARVPHDYQGERISFFTPRQIGEYRNSGPPAMAYEIGDDRFETNTGARMGPRAAAQGKGDPLFIAATTINIHVLGNDPDDTHELRRMAIAALWDIGHQSYRLAGGTWNTGDVQSNGFAYVLGLTLDIPITRDPEAIVVVTGFEPNDASIQKLGDNAP